MSVASQPVGVLSAALFIDPLTAVGEALQSPEWQAGIGWPLWQLALAVGVCMLLDAWFSAAGEALTALDTAQLSEAAEEGDGDAEALLKHLSRREPLMGVAMTGATLSLMGTVVFLLLATEHFWPELNWLWLILPLGLLLGLLGDTLPRAWSFTQPWQRSGLLIAPLRVFSLLFAPATWLVSVSSRLFVKAFPARAGIDSMVTREELRELLIEAAAEDVKPHERQMLKRVLDFGSLTVKDAMVPLSKVVAVHEGATLQRASEVFTQAGHSRLPIYRRKTEQVVGVLHAYDVLFADDLNASVRTLERPARYVQQTVLLEHLLADLQRSRMGMAIVISDVGAAVGIITVEDILEQIVGDIKDEFDD